MSSHEALYRQALIDSFERMTFGGIAASGPPLSLGLLDIYVDLLVTVEPSDKPRELQDPVEGCSSTEQESLPAAPLSATGASAGGTLAKILSQPRCRGLVVLGDPGGGKTALLHSLALRYAQRDGKRLPIYLPLAAYDEHLRGRKERLPLADFLPLYYQQLNHLPDLTKLFRDAMESGRALLLLDGLDEVQDTAARHQVAQEVNSLFQIWARWGNQFVITSRVVGYHQAPVTADLDHAHLLPLHDQQVEEFARKWSYAYETWLAGGPTPVAQVRAQAEQEELLRDIRSNPGVQRLAQTPLLLTILAILRRRLGKFPDRRIELYDVYVRTLIDQRGFQRGQGSRPVPGSERLDAYTAVDYLMELALWLHLHHKSGSAQQDELERSLVEIVLRHEGYDESAAPGKARERAGQIATQFLRDIPAFTGLLVEKGRGAYGFQHLTFQEYFVGRALARMDPEERWAVILPHIHDPRWQEPILLCAGWLGIVERRRDVVSDLGQRILSAETPYETLLHRDLFLAVRLVKDDVSLSPVLMGEIHDRLRPLGESDVATIRDQALTGLADLAQAGQEQAITTLRSMLEDTREDVQTAATHALAPLVASEPDELDDHLLATVILQFGVVWAVQPRFHPKIRAALQNPSREVRRSAISVFSFLRPAIPDLSQLLINALQDQDPEIRKHAILSLADHWRELPQVQPFLLATLQDPDEGVRQAAVVHLAPLRGGSPEARTMLDDTLDDPSPRVRRTAVNRLSHYWATAPGVRQRVLAAMQDPDQEIRLAAIGGLPIALSADPEFREGLLIALHDTYWAVRRAAGVRLSLQWSDNPQVRAALLGVLTADSDAEVRATMLTTVALRGPDGAALATALNSALDDSSAKVRSGAILAIQIANKVDSFRDRILRLLLRDSDPHVRLASIYVLGPLLRIDSEVDQAVHAALDDPDVGVRGSAVRCVAQSEVYDEARFARLARLLAEDSDPGVRDSAYNALLQLAALPELESTAEQFDPHALRLYVVALESFKAASQPARIPLRPFTVLIGRNGAGKSTLLEALQWLDVAIRHSAQRACERYHGLHDLLNLRARSETVLAEPAHFHIALEWDFAPPDHDPRPLRYEVKVRESAEAQRPVIASESLYLIEPQTYWIKTEPPDSSRRLIYPGKPYQSEFDETDRLALGRIGHRLQADLDDPLGFLRRYWERAVFLRLSPNFLMRGSPPYRNSFDPLLDEEGQMLPALLNELDQEQRSELAECLHDVLPDIDGVEILGKASVRDELISYALKERMSGPGRQRSVAIPAWMLSEGTRRLTAIFALLLRRPPPSLLCIEELENGLDPWTVLRVLEHLRSATRRGVHVMVTTHSPWLLDHVQLGDILQVRRKNGETTYERFADRKEIQDYLASVPPGARFINEME